MLYLLRLRVNITLKLYQQDPYRRNGKIFSQETIQLDVETDHKRKTYVYI